MSDVNYIINMIKNNNRFAIVTHDNPDADAIGSALFLEQFLLRLNKDVIFIIQSKISNDFKYIIGDRLNKIIVPKNKKYDVLFILDTSDYNRIYYYDNIASNIIIIDHHLKSNVYCDKYINYNDVSTGVTLFKLFNNFIITPFMATCLYLTIIGDTDSFRTPNINFEIYEIASKLIKLGADVGLVNNIHNNINIEYIDLLSNVIKNIKINKQKKIVSLIIDNEQIKASSASVRDANKIIDFMKNINDIDIAILLIDNNGTITVRVRSKKKDISNILTEYDGGGHKNSVGCLIKNSDPYDILEYILKKI